jgi:hypothetical protein
MAISQELQQAQQAIYQINKEFNDVDWQRFESEQPGEAALARQKMMEQHQQAQGQIMRVKEHEAQSARENIQAMSSKLIELVPEWKDAEVRGTEQGEIRGALIEAGYTPNMLANAQDPIAISLVRELLQLRKQVSGANDEVARVRKAPKVLRNSSGRFAAKANQQALDAVAQAKKSPTKHSELAAAKALLGMK